MNPLTHLPSRTHADAFIFDLDGTLVDNMALHAEAFGAFALRHGLPPLTVADRARIDGRRNSEIFPILFGRGMPREEWLQYEEEKESLYRELSRGRLRPMPGATALLAALAARGLPSAIATSAPAANVAHTLGELQLADAFTCIVRGDEVARGKPAPDVFLECARRLGVEPARCVVFEDAPMGIEAARAAGMTCVALTTSFAAATLRSSDARPHAACANFTEYLADTGRWLAG